MYLPRSVTQHQHVDGGYAPVANRRIEEADDRVPEQIPRRARMSSLFARAFSRLFLASQQCFFLTTNQPTVLSAVYFQQANRLVMSGRHKTTLCGWLAPSVVQIHIHVLCLEGVLCVYSTDTGEAFL
jgi:hypothetical protein